jgi:hypothetical protein
LTNVRGRVTITAPTPGDHRCSSRVTIGHTLSDHRTPGAHVLRDLIISEGRRDALIGVIVVVP